MRTRVRIASAFLGGLLAFLIPAPASAQQESAPGGGVIDGRVTGPDRRPIEKVRVTLMSDSYSTLATKYTDSSGRFRFPVLEGAYYVDIDPADKPFERYRERVEVNLAPFSRGNDLFHVEITLVPRAAGDKPAAIQGVRFAQAVPEPARKEYERGTKLLKDKPEEAIAALQKAIELFPDYYAARESLGTELVKGARYDEARPVLVRALEINPSGEGSLYALGVLRYRTGEFAPAVESLTSANAINAKSPNITLYLGLALWRAGRPGDAEVYLKRAYELGAKGVADQHLALASIYIQAKRNKEAATELRRLLDEVPNLRDRDKIKGLIEKLEKGG